jgi:predicted transcriptional regulator
VLPVKIVLAEREAELMQILREHGPSTVAEVQAHQKDELAYTALLTMLQKLAKKGVVNDEKLSEKDLQRIQGLIDVGKRGDKT